MIRSLVLLTLQLAAVMAIYSFSSWVLKDLTINQLAAFGFTMYLIRGLRFKLEPVSPGSRVKFPVLRSTDE